jgi:hypothetical protein
MMYVVVNQATGVKVTFPRTGKTMYATLRTARAAVTRLCKMDQYPTQYVIMEATVYNAQVPMMTVTNLMTGKPLTIPADTPWCCNPSSETYWSM